MGVQPTARTRAMTLLAACASLANTSSLQPWWHSEQLTSMLRVALASRCADAADTSADKSWHLPQRLQANCTTQKAWLWILCERAAEQTVHVLSMMLA